MTKPDENSYPVIDLIKATLISLAIVLLFAFPIVGFLHAARVADSAVGCEYNTIAKVINVGYWFGCELFKPRNW